MSLIANSRPGQPATTKFDSKGVLDYVVVELRYESGVAVSANGFQAGAQNTTAQALNALLDGFKIKRCASHFGLKSIALKNRAVAAPNKAPAKVSAEFAQSGVVQLIPQRTKDCAELVKRLNKHKAVWNAYIAPRPVPAASPNMEPAQGYLYGAPDGVNAMEAWAYQGGQGEGIAVCDIEGGWNVNHEDLPAVVHFGGTLQGGDWENHGTAVLGEIVAKPNAFGCVGIAPRAKPKVHSAVINGVFNTAQAITNSANRLKAGDVILIELQGTHPVSGSYVAMQYWDDTFSAIRAATEKGITVVEAAGNGNQNFQAAVYNGSNLRKDAGAIVVGAGVPPTNYYDHTQEPGQRYTSMGTPRSRAWFSNYGKIVNVQGWGEHVTTLGYGDAQGGAKSKWYTHRFSGTSSASPIVTGAVACLQGIAKTTGGPFTPEEVRSILIKSGTRQANDPVRPRSEHIGPLPNLLKAIETNFN